MYDVVIIGGGITGCAVARYLSRYRVKACLIERGEDVCSGTSKANSGIVHAGYDAKHGSKMAELNLMGSRMYPDLAKELDFEYEQNGSLVIATDWNELPKLEELYNNGMANGVRNLELISSGRLKLMEPHISPDAKGALFAPTGGIVCPFGATIALAENAYTNGVGFRLGCAVTGVTPFSDEVSRGWIVQTESGAVRTRAVVNAAGVYADLFHNMVSAKKIHITPKRGDYLLLDKSTGGYVRHTIFQLPGAYGKGVLVSPTVHGNTIVGPTAVDIDDREGTNTTAEGLDSVITKAGQMVKDLPVRQVITSFAGLRAHEDGKEFLIGEVPDAPGFIDCAGIESPGLSSAPAIGLTVSDLLRDMLHLEENPGFDGTRKGIPRISTLPLGERAALIRENPAYGQIICRCEEVSEGEIVDAIRRPLGARSLDGVKRRVRAGMGRCQAGFCSPRVLEILSEETGIPQNELTKCGGTSRVITGYAKDSV